MKKWIHAFRLRTLPLSLSGIIMGGSLSYESNTELNFVLFILALITTLLFQILSNLANDLGDSLKGTDNSNRIGPSRSIQSGVISQKSMKKAIYLFSLLSLISASILILLGTQKMSQEIMFIYFCLAITAIVSAITYTIGKKAYGYHGFGDLFVFIFFGCVSVIGSFVLFTNEFEFSILLIAVSMGSLSTMVLNLNNMRDIINDKECDKRTLVVKLGLKKAKIYHLCLFLMSFLSLCIYTLFYTSEIGYWMTLIPFGLLYAHILKVFKTNNSKDFDPELKKVALSTFSIALLFFICSIL